MPRTIRSARIAASVTRWCPDVRIGLRVMLGYFLIVALAAWLVARVFVAEVKPGVRQAMEDTLVDTANVLAELATDDFVAGRINDGAFARRIANLRGRDFGADIWGFDKRGTTYRIYVTDARGRVVYDSDARNGGNGDVGRDYSRWNDVLRTLRGEYGARSTLADPDDKDSSVMHVAAPIRDASGAIIGVLTVAKPNVAIAPFIERSQRTVLRWGLVLMVVALGIGLLATWWLSRQLGALRRYALAVTRGERVPVPDAAGEFGDLGRALDTMRARLDGKQYVEQYVHALTHEMKSPLAAIRSSAELLDADADATPMPDADRARFIHAIRSQADRLTQMIDKLLALAAVEHRQVLESPLPVSLDSVAHEAAQACESRLREAGVEVRFESDPGLPQVQGDAFLLRQALVNLIDNACDFAPHGCPLTVRVSADGASQRVQVLDSGPGVPDYATDRVFERFYSLPRPARGGRSSGLGLCFVAEVAQLHGGDAWLRNRDTGGADAGFSVAT